MSENNAAYDVHATRDLTITTEYFDVHTVVYLPIYFSSFDYNGQIYEVFFPPFPSPPHPRSLLSLFDSRNHTYDVRQVLVSGNKGVVVGNERPIGMTTCSIPSFSFSFSFLSLCFSFVSPHSYFM